MPRFIKFNPTKGQQRVFRVDDIIDIKAMIPNSVSIFFDHMGGEPYNFNLHIEDFCASVFSDEHDKEYSLVELDEDPNFDKLNDDTIKNIS